MKTITLKSKKRLLPNKGYITALALFAYGIGNAQVQNNGSIYVGNNAKLHVVSGTYNFGTSPLAKTQTSRTTSNYGVISFQNSAVTAWNGQSDNHQVDGYIGRYDIYTGAQPVKPIQLLPTGNGTIHAPIGFNVSLIPPFPTVGTAFGVEAAFFQAPATDVGTNMAAAIETVSPVEHWKTRSTHSNSYSRVTLTWRASSDVATLTKGALNNLTIVAWNGTIWSQLPDTAIDSGSTFTNGSITTVPIYGIGNYSAFALAAIKDPCEILVTSSGTTKTWNGSWLPSAPGIADPVVINAPYSGGSFSCNSIVLNANVTLTDGQSLEIVNGSTGTGKIIMSSQASLLQRNSSAPAPNIELTKTSREMRRYDYVYWGTPIVGDFKSQLTGAIAHGQATAGAFDLEYKYVSGTGGGWNTLDAVQTGRGFITRIKEQAPFINATAQENIDLKFTGVANNGNVNVAIVNNPAAPNGGTSHNLVANPYPSAIDVDKFLFENKDIDGAVYLWTAATSSGSSSTTTSYTQADYAVYNFSGETNTSPIAQKIAGRIASGQGFKVKALNAGNVTFTNCMRVADGNTNFFRTANNTENDKDRFKLTMTNEGAYSQILVAYLPDATLAYDRLYDAGRNSTSTVQLYSILENDGKKLAINGRPTFFDTDVVALGVSKNNTNAETFTINIEQKEGVFSGNQASVYLHDKALQTYHDFNNGGYTFTTSETVSNNRFEIVYRNSALSNPDFKTASVNASIKNQTFKAISSLGIKEVEVYDISGRKIMQFNAEGQNNTTKAFNHADGVYIAKIKLENGTIATQKLINQK